MYPSTKKQPPFAIIFIVVLVAFAVGGYLVYDQWQKQQSNSLEISLNSPEIPGEEASSPSTSSSASSETSALASAVSPPDSLSEPPPPILPENQEVLERLTESLALQEQLQLSNQELASALEQSEAIQKRIERLLLGREVLSDFSTRFIKYKDLLGGDSFFRFFQKLVTLYIENRSISVEGINTEDPLFRKLHQDFVVWVISQDNERIQALAEFVGFHLVEYLYQLPLTLLASSLVTEIEVIDFNIPVTIENQGNTSAIPPIRDDNGELKMDKSAHLDNYTDAQQFLYRRGPQFSSKVLLFLNTYLAYEGY